MAFPHNIANITIDNQTDYLISDCDHDRILLINSQQQIVWIWDLTKFNWTTINPLWGPTSYYNSPTSVDWSHVNDVKFIPGSALNQTFDSLLISIRNFNLIVLVNWTAELNDIMQGSRYGNLNNVYWYFGNNGTFTTLAQQHNPSLLPNGDIVIADSNNNRVIEINRTTKQIVWSLSQLGELILIGLGI